MPFLCFVILLTPDLLADSALSLANAAIGVFLLSILYLLLRRESNHDVKG